MIYPIPKTVPEAAKILDEAMPGWYQKIDTDTLDMARDACILGQLYPNSATGFDKLFGADEEFCNPPFGFVTDKNEWISQINNRIKTTPRFAEAFKSSIIVQYPDGFRERFNSELDIPLGVRYRVVFVNN